MGLSLHEDRLIPPRRTRHHRICCLNRRKERCGLLRYAFTYAGVGSPLQPSKTPAKLKAKGFLPYRLEILTDDEYEQLIDRGESVDWLSQECFSRDDLRKWVRKQKENEEYERVVALGLIKPSEAYVY
jgi:hypothetical protein